MCFAISSVDKVDVGCIHDVVLFTPFRHDIHGKNGEVFIALTIFFTNESESASLYILHRGEISEIQNDFLSLEGTPPYLNWITNRSRKIRITPDKSRDSEKTHCVRVESESVALSGTYEILTANAQELIKSYRFTGSKYLPNSIFEILELQNIPKGKFALRLALKSPVSRMRIGEDIFLNIVSPEDVHQEFVMGYPEAVEAQRTETEAGRSRAMEIAKYYKRAPSYNVIVAAKSGEFEYRIDCSSNISLSTRFVERWADPGDQRDIYALYTAFLDTELQNQNSFFINLIAKALVPDLFTRRLVRLNNDLISSVNGGLPLEQVLAPVIDKLDAAGFAKGFLLTIRPWKGVSPEKLLATLDRVGVSWSVLKDRKELDDAHDGHIVRWKIPSSQASGEKECVSFSFSSDTQGVIALTAIEDTNYDAVRALREGISHGIETLLIREGYLAPGVPPKDKLRKSQETISEIIAILEQLKNAAKLGIDRPEEQLYEKQWSLIEKLRELNQYSQVDKNLDEISSALWMLIPQIEEALTEATVDALSYVFARLRSGRLDFLEVDSCIERLHHVGLNIYKL